MASRRAQVLFALALLVVLASFPADGGDSEQVQSRQFEFTYRVTVPALSPGSAPLRLWVPLPVTDTYQTVSNLRIESPVRYRVQKDPEYRNLFAYFVVQPAQAKAAFDVVLRFHATRREHRVALDKPRAANLKPIKPTPEMQRLLRPDRLVPLDGVIAELARQQTQGVTDPLEKARKIYDYVVATMRYDKTGQGWGNGDALWACDSKRGNCTDFHSVFIGMMRASGIPARFEIGFPLPDNKTEGVILGYHCWAEFYIEGIGWIPVDASEAWKNPAKRDYFFGAHDDNRVLFTYGRDLRLNNDQKGAPLNYFIYPYAEVGGKPSEKLPTQFAFRDHRAAALLEAPAAHVTGQ